MFCIAAESGEPLAGVEVIATSQLRDAVGSVKTDSNGYASFPGLLAGQYYLAMSHPSRLPAKSNIHPSLRVMVPGEPVRVEWITAYAYGIELFGGLVDVRLPPRPKHFTPEATQPGFHERSLKHGLEERLVTRQDTQFVGIYAMSRAGEDLSQPLTMEVVGFHPEKGPCTFTVPVHPIEELSELTVLDPAGSPVVEAMSCIKTTTKDARGEPVNTEGASLFLAKRRPKNGFMSTDLPPNGTRWVPAGEYRVASSSAWVDAGENTIHVTAGETRELEFYSRFQLAEVELRFVGAPESGKLAFQSKLDDSGGVQQYSPHKMVSSGDKVWLPVGVNIVNLLFVSQDSVKPVEKVRTVTVRGEYRKPQVIVVDLS